MGKLKKRFVFLALGLIALAIVLPMVHRLSAPQILRVAVGPVGGHDVKVVVAFLQALQRERADLRLKLVLTDGPRESAEQLSAKKVDLAVARTDSAMPPEAATIAIMRRDAVFFVTRPGAKIEKISDLRGKNIGYLAGRAANARILTQILTHYGVPEAEMMQMPGQIAEIMARAQEGGLDAIFVVGPIADRVTRLALQAFPDSGDEKAGLLAITEADALSTLYPALDTVEIDRGAFGGDPPRPDETVTTLATTHRLVARRVLDEAQVSELTRLLFALRPSMAVDAPLANEIELPAVDDRGAVYPVHAGTTAYVEGATKTFFERYGDWIYLVIMAVSLLGSVVAALSSRIFGKSAPKSDAASLAPVLDLIEQAQDAPDRAELAAIEQSAQRLFRAHLVAHAGDAPADLLVFFMLRQELRQVVAARRLSFDRPIIP
jgi:TRAP transporter TAXI family solute receptor